MSWRKWLFLISTASLLAGCTANPATTIFHTNSMIAEQKLQLFNILFWMGVGVFLLVAVLLALAIIRGRRQPGDNSEPRQNHGNVRLEIIWTVIPILLVVYIFFITVRTMNAVAAPPREDGDLTVRVIGHRWFWEFQYPDLGITTANDLVIPEDTNIHLELVSVDVIHSFWVPNLSGKIDVVPGQQNSMWIRADNPGTFMGHCGEYCGMQHANMHFNVIARSADDFTAWVQGQQQPVAAAQGTLEEEGEQIVTAGVCAGCHTIQGTKMVGKTGPDLTHLYSRTIIAGGFPLDDATLEQWLRNSDELKPGNLMAGIRVSDQQIEAVMAYLKTLR
ncbi:MAG TPA: cytochrome c oxidase subunit II [Anaerolineaceae bacterium]